MPRAPEESAHAPPASRIHAAHRRSYGYLLLIICERRFTEQLFYLIPAAQALAADFELMHPQGLHSPGSRAKNTVAHCRMASMPGIEQSIFYFSSDQWIGLPRSC